MFRRYVLRDDREEKAKDTILCRKETVEANAKDNPLFINTVLFQYRVIIL